MIAGSQLFEPSANEIRYGLFPLIAELLVALKELKQLR
jgi:hypothetical protein